MATQYVPRENNIEVMIAVDTSIRAEIAAGEKRLLVRP